LLGRFLGGVDVLDLTWARYCALVVEVMEVNRIAAQRPKSLEEVHAEKARS
jgi:hypothetical protein